MGLGFRFLPLTKKTEKFPCALRQGQNTVGFQKAFFTCSATRATAPDMLPLQRHDQKNELGFIVSCILERGLQKARVVENPFLPTSPEL